MRKALGRDDHHDANGKEIRGGSPNDHAINCQNRHDRNKGDNCDFSNPRAALHERVPRPQIVEPVLDFRCFAVDLVHSVPAQSKPLAWGLLSIA